jgi:CRP-like cAMP-binding protein
MGVPLRADDYGQRYAIRCDSCPLRQRMGIRPFTADEAAVVERMKTRHRRAAPGAVLIEQGASQPRLFTLFSGWALRTKTLSSGKVQVLEVLLPGALVGLSTLMFRSNPYSVYAVTDATMCEFDRTSLTRLFAVPTLAHLIAHNAELEVVRLEGRLASIGAADATSRVAYFFADLFARLERRKMTEGLSFRLPLTHEQIADAVGTTRVHVSRVLRQLRRDRLLLIDDKVVTLPNVGRLREIGNFDHPLVCEPIL